MSSGGLPICFTCSRYQGGLRCEAFPTRIPEDITLNQADHRAPRDGDAGLTWKSSGRGPKVAMPEAVFGKAPS